jgi:vacuolar iron transporter family protein
VTNASLIAGVGGGGVSAHAIVLTRVAALVAGAFSMGTGEYISVTNQNELVHAEVALERQMLARFPAPEQDELAGYFHNYGADPETTALTPTPQPASPPPSSATRAPRCGCTPARNSASTRMSCPHPCSQAPRRCWPSLLVP